MKEQTAPWDAQTASATAEQFARTMRCGGDVESHEVCRKLPRYARPFLMGVAEVCFRHCGRTLVA